MLYAPALALSAVTGLHFEGAVIGIGSQRSLDELRNNEKDLCCSNRSKLNKKPAFEKDWFAHSTCFYDNDDDDDDCDDQEFAKCL